MADQRDRDVALAFDGQAAKFEKAPVQSDPGALASLVAFADLPEDSLVLDAGCGPGLVCRALLEAGHRVVGVDLSPEMIQRARARCASFGDRATFRVGPLDGLEPATAFDASISRYVLHHVADPDAFVARQVGMVRPGGFVILSDQSTDADPAEADEHQAIERMRDRTHARNLSAGAIVDLFARVGLVELRMIEESFTLDFDEWFDRGSPSSSKDETRRRVELAPASRSFDPLAGPDGGLTLRCWRATVRGVRPSPDAGRRG